MEKKTPAERLLPFDRNKSGKGFRSFAIDAQAFEVLQTLQLGDRLSFYELSKEEYEAKRAKNPKTPSGGILYIYRKADYDAFCAKFKNADAPQAQAETRAQPVAEPPAEDDLAF